jgi:hypothetical protein
MWTGRWRRNWLTAFCLVTHSTAFCALGKRKAAAGLHCGFLGPSPLRCATFSLPWNSHHSRGGDSKDDVHPSTTAEGFLELCVRDRQTDYQLISTSIPIGPKKAADKLRDREIKRCSYKHFRWNKTGTKRGMRMWRTERSTARLTGHVWRKGRKMLQGKSPFRESDRKNEKNRRRSIRKENRKTLRRRRRTATAFCLSRSAIHSVRSIVSQTKRLTGRIKTELN